MRLLLFLASVSLAQPVLAVPAGDAGTAQRKAEERGQIPGVPPCLAAIRLLPFAPGRPEEPKCHCNFVLEPPGSCHALTHGQDSGQARVHAEPPLPPAARPLRPPHAAGRARTAMGMLFSSSCSLPEPAPCKGTFLP